jgi:hypothetical protein
MTQVGGENSTGGQQLLTALDHINMAQDASGNNDTLKAFQEINIEVQSVTVAIKIDFCLTLLLVSMLPTEMNYEM